MYVFTIDQNVLFTIILTWTSEYLSFVNYHYPLIEGQHLRNEFWIKQIELHVISGSHLLSKSQPIHLYIVIYLSHWRHDQKTKHTQKCFLWRNVVIRKICISYLHLGQMRYSPTPRWNKLAITSKLSCKIMHRIWECLTAHKWT